MVTGSSREILEFVEVYKSFKGLGVLDGLNLSVHEGEIICIIGPSGCGKSTTLRCANKLILPDKGEIYFKGCLTTSKDFENQRSKIAMVFQNFNLWPHLNIIGNVSLAQIKVLGKSKEQAHLKSREVLKQVGLTEKALAYPAELSGGQQQRVGIARALAMEPDLLLFDEPTSALDPELVSEVLDVIVNLSREGKTMIIVTHEIEFARKISDRILFMCDGRIDEEGTPSEVMENRQNKRLTSFLKSVN